MRSLSGLKRSIFGKRRFRANAMRSAEAGLYTEYDSALRRNSREIVTVIAQGGVR